MALHRLARLPALRNISHPRLACTFTSAPILAAKPLPPRRVILDSELEENFLKGSGPGGQKINKTSSAVQLKHLPTGIVVKCQDTRSRTQNRKVARRLLSDRLEELELGENSRTAIKGRQKGKKKASADKKKRRKYRALADGKEAEDGETEEGEEALEEEDIEEDRTPLKTTEGSAEPVGKAG